MIEFATMCVICGETLFGDEHLTTCGEPECPYPEREAMTKDHSASELNDGKIRFSKDVNDATTKPAAILTYFNY